MTFCSLTNQLISNAPISFSQTPLVTPFHELQTTPHFCKLQSIHVSWPLILNISLFTNVVLSVKITSFTFFFDQPGGLVVRASGY